MINSQADKESRDIELTLRDVMQSLVRHARLIIALPLVAGILALIYVFSLPPTYTASFKAMIVSQHLEYMRRLPTIIPAIVESGKVGDYVKRRLGSVENGNPLQGGLDAGDVRVSMDTDGVFEVYVDGHEPDQVKAIADLYAEGVQRIMPRFSLELGIVPILQNNAFLLQKRKEVSATEQQLRNELVKLHVPDEYKNVHIPFFADIVSLKTRILIKEAEIETVGRVFRAYGSFAYENFAYENFAYEKMQGELASMLVERDDLVKQQRISVSEVVAEYYLKRADLESNRAFKRVLDKRQKLAELDEQKAVPAVVILNPAKEGVKTGPNMLMPIFIALIASLLIAVIYFIGLDFIERTAS